jgi:hypothetical protein
MTPEAIHLGSCHHRSRGLFTAVVSWPLSPIVSLKEPADNGLLGR